ncbi:hypothetical protein THAOC_24413, partial [Thalassiosira oceanica]
RGGAEDASAPSPPPANGGGRKTPESGGGTGAGGDRGPNCVGRKEGQCGTKKIARADGKDNDDAC